jgi:hypothetical protein
MALVQLKFDLNTLMGPFHRAVQLNLHGACQALLDQGLDLNEKDEVNIFLLKPSPHATAWKHTSRVCP